LARVWEVATGKELESFPFTGSVKSVIFHPNNTTIVAGSADKNTVIHTLSVTRLVVAAPGPIRGLAVIPAGTHVLTAADDKTAKLWNLATGAAERTFPGGDGACNAVTVNKNSQLVAVGGADKTVRLYNLADAKPAGTLPTPGVIRGLAFSPNNATLAAACEDKSILTWNVAFTPGQPMPPTFGKVLQTYAHAGPVTDVVFAADNVTLYTGSQDKTAKAWKIATDAPTKNLAHPNLVDAVAFNQAGTMLATGCHDGIVRIWDVAKGMVLKQTPAHTIMIAGQAAQPAPVYCVAWSPDGKQVVSGSFDHSMKLWDATAGTLVKEFKGYKEKEFDKGHTDGVFCVAFSPDGKTLASGSSDRSIKLWNAADGTVLREFVNPNLKPIGDRPVSHPGWVYGVRFTTDGKYLLSAGSAVQNRGFVAAWTVADGKLVYGEELPVGQIHSLALSPDGKVLGLGCGPQGRPVTEVNSFLLKLPDAVK
jgi:WD40 repeat protein